MVRDRNDKLSQMVCYITLRGTWGEVSLYRVGERTFATDHLSFFPFCSIRHVHSHVQDIIIHDIYVTRKCFII